MIRKIIKTAAWAVLVGQVAFAGSAFAAATTLEELLQQVRASRQAEALIQQRGAAILSGVTENLDERQRALEVSARLLAQHGQVARHAAAGNASALARELGPLQETLGIGRITVLGQTGTEIVHLGAQTPAAELRGLVIAALRGITHSAAVAGDGGLTVGAATPINFLAASTLSSRF